jgi:hypothetical protein
MGPGNRIRARCMSSARNALRKKHSSASRSCSRVPGSGLLVARPGKFPASCQGRYTGRRRRWQSWQNWRCYHRRGHAIDRLVQTEHQGPLPGYPTCRCHRRHRHRLHRHRRHCHRRHRHRRHCHGRSTPSRRPSRHIRRPNSDPTRLCGPSPSLPVPLPSSPSPPAQGRRGPHRWHPGCRHYWLPSVFRGLGTGTDSEWPRHYVEGGRLAAAALLCRPHLGWQCHRARCEAAPEPLLLPPPLAPPPPPPPLAPPPPPLRRATALPAVTSYRSRRPERSAASAL